MIRSLLSEEIDLETEAIEDFLIYEGFLSVTVHIREKVNNYKQLLPCVNNSGLSKIIRV